MNKPKTKQTPRTSATVSLKLEDQLCFRLYLASKTITQAYQQILKPLGITYPQYLALLVLWEKDGISVKELGEKLHLDSGTLSPLLKKLEQRNVLRRQRDANDERSVALHLTPEGRALKGRAQKDLERLLCQFDLNSRSARALRDSIKTLTDVLLKHLSSDAP